MNIKHVYKNNKEIENFSIKAWVISNRGNSKIRFISLNDGSTIENIQVVYKGQEMNQLDSLKLGSSVKVDGKVILTPEGKQPLELVANSISILKNSDDDFPLQKKETSKEFLREIPHIRHRTNLFRSIMRVRSTLSQKIHEFFSNNDFLNVSSPIITSNDGEGAGEAFIVDEEGEKNFFGKKATLGVTGQLHAEAYAQGFGKVYTFAPTFRAEHSHTQRHASEFWMVEPEMAFTGIDEGIKTADELLKFVIGETMILNKKEIDYLDSVSKNDLNKKLTDFISKGVQKLDYKEAIELLKKAPVKFDNDKIEFGIDLSTEHEKYLCEKIFEGPVAIVNYPKAIKSFYMKENPSDKNTVLAFDILVPGVGELIGGSERESDYDKLLERCKKMNMIIDDIQWYLDLRRYGYDQSTGFGLGFERLVMYVTGVDNIRDSIPFPRTPNNLKM